jgi:arsenate reductase (thioredoxin)
MKRQPKKILFVCYGNSCRSILAEALARHFWGKGLQASSAGLIPLGHITRHTLEALDEAGISSAGLRSKGLPDIPLEDIDYLVNLTDLKIDDMIPPSFSGKMISHYVHDPYGEGLDAFRKARNELERLVKEELPRLIAGNDEPGN